MEKQLYEYFKRQTNEIAHELSWKWMIGGNLKRETESILTAAQNNVIRTNCFKVKIDDEQKITSVGGDKDETVCFYNKWK